MREITEASICVNVLSCGTSVTIGLKGFGTSRSLQRTTGPLVSPGGVQQRQKWNMTEATKNWWTRKLMKHHGLSALDFRTSRLPLIDMLCAVA